MSDFAIVRGNFGASGVGFTGGDADRNGVVGIGDFAIVQQNFGAELIPPPTTPGELSISSLQQGRLHLSWLEPATSSGVPAAYDGFRVYRTTDPNDLNPPLVAELRPGNFGVSGVGGGMVTWVDGSLDDATRYYYKVHPFTEGTPSRSRAWGLDALGNWLSVTDEAGATQTRSHDARNRIVGVTGGGGGGGGGGGATPAYTPAYTPTYTANGEMTRDLDGRVFTYDAWGRAASADGAGGVGGPPVLYAHDALGRRVAAGDTRFYYNDRRQVLEERHAGSPAAGERFVWSAAYIDAMVLRDRLSPDTTGDGHAEERLYVLQDANHNVVAAADASGAVVQRYAYDPYGARTVLDAGWASAAAPLLARGHQGGRHDDAAGVGGAGGLGEAGGDVVHFRHRDLLTAEGRWDRPDPLGYVDGMNAYEYVRGSPASATDPSGLFSLGGILGASVRGLGTVMKFSQGSAAIRQGLINAPVAGVANGAAAWFSAATATIFFSQQELVLCLAFWGACLQGHNC